MRGRATEREAVAKELVKTRVSRRRRNNEGKVVCITCQSRLGQCKSYGRYRNRRRRYQPPVSRERKRGSNFPNCVSWLWPTFIRLIFSMHLKKSSNSNILLSSFSISPARTGVISPFRPLRVGGVCCVHVGRGRMCGVQI